MNALLLALALASAPFSSARNGDGPGAVHVCTQTITGADGTVLASFDCTGSLTLAGGLISIAPVVNLGPFSSEQFNFIARGGQPASAWVIDLLSDGGPAHDWPDGGTDGWGVFEITPRPSDGTVEFNLAAHNGLGGTVQTEGSLSQGGRWTFGTLSVTNDVSATGYDSCQAALIRSDDNGGGAPCTGATTIQGWAPGNEFTWQHWSGSPKYAFLRLGGFQATGALIPGTTLPTCTVSTYDDTQVPEGAQVTKVRSGGTPTKLCICVNTAGTPTWASMTLAAGALSLVTAGGSATVCP